MTKNLDRLSLQRQRRMIALERQVQRLQRHLDRLHAVDRRFSWYRLVVFSLGLAAAWLALVYLDTNAVWMVVILALASFSTVVFFHRRLDGWVARYRILQQIKADKLARMRLDWVHIPYANPPISQEERSSL